MQKNWSNFAKKIGAEENVKPNIPFHVKDDIDICKDIPSTRKIHHLLY